MKKAPENTYPVRKALSFTEEQWSRVEAFRFDRRINTVAETVRFLIDAGLKAKEGKPAKG